MILITPAGALDHITQHSTSRIFLAALRAFDNFTISEPDAIEVIHHKLLDEHITVTVIIYIHLLVPEQLP